MHAHEAGSCCVARPTRRPTAWGLNKETSVFHQVGGWYLAVDAWLSAAVLVLPLLCCPAKSAELSSVAIADDDGDPLALLERKSSVVHM